MSRPRKHNKHLPPCVYQKHGGFWYVKGGKWTRIGDDLQTAMAEYSRLVEKPQGGMPALVRKVFKHIEPTLANSTAQQYRYAVTRIEEAFAEFAPHQILPKHVAALKLDMANTPNMANRVLSFLRVVFSYAVEWQIVDSNPCIGIKRHEEAKRKRYLTDAEFAAIRAHAHPRLQIVMDLLYLTGQRVTDVLRIKRADITDAGILFEQQKTGTKLLVKWTPQLRDTVARANALGSNVVGLNLFRTRARGGKPPSYGVTKDQWNEARAAAGIQDATIHDIRAKSLTDAKRQGKDAQALGGHASAAMTERYIRLREVPLVEGPEFSSKIA